MNDPNPWSTHGHPVLFIDLEDVISERRLDLSVQLLAERVQRHFKMARVEQQFLHPANVALGPDGTSPLNVDCAERRSVALRETR